MGNIIIDPRWGFDSVVIGVAALIIAVISIKEPRARLFSVITIGISALICVLVFVPNLLIGLLWGAISIVLSYSGLYIQEKLPTLFEIVTGMILLIFGVLGLVLLIQLETLLFLTSLDLDWPSRLSTFIVQFIFIILLPLIMLGIRHLWRSSLLINRFSVIYKNTIITILVISGVFFIIAFIGSEVITMMNNAQLKNALRLALLFLIDIFCIILVYSIWFKKSNFTFKCIYILLGLQGLVFISIDPVIGNFYINNDVFQNLMLVLTSLSFYWMTFFWEEKWREVRPRTPSYPRGPRTPPIPRRATRYLEVYEERNQRPTIYSARDRSLNRNEPNLPMADELNEEKPYHDSSPSTFERPHSSNSQKRNRRRKDRDGGDRRFYPRV